MADTLISFLVRAFILVVVAAAAIAVLAAVFSFLQVYIGTPKR